MIVYHGFQLIQNIEFRINHRRKPFVKPRHVLYFVFSEEVQHIRRVLEFVDELRNMRFPRMFLAGLDTLNIVGKGRGCGVPFTQFCNLVIRALSFRKR